MKHFRLNFILLVLAIIALTAIATALFIRGLWPQGICALIGTGICVALLAGLNGRLIHVMSSFVSALEMNDTTMQFDFGNSGTALRYMSEAMNRIVDLYRSNMREIETAKLYYDRILRVMSHEMRNSVTPVIALTDDMSRHPGKYTPGKLGEALDVIGSQCRGIRRFLDAYWQLTHIPEPQKVITDCHSFFRNIRRLADIEARDRGLGENVCRFSIGQGTELCIDPSLITQAIINLLRNALDAVCSCPEPLVTVTVSMAGGHPYIVVADNGAGIDPAVRQSLFQPFVTSKPHGSGVGLCLSRQIIRQHGGELRLLSAAASGTTFAITLP